MKADDLLDRLIEAATDEVDTRHPELRPTSAPTWPSDRHRRAALLYAEVHQAVGDCL